MFADTITTITTTTSEPTLLLIQLNEQKHSLPVIKAAKQQCNGQLLIQLNDPNIYKQLLKLLQQQQQQPTRLGHNLQRLEDICVQTDIQTILSTFFSDKKKLIILLFLLNMRTFSIL